MKFKMGELWRSPDFMRLWSGQAVSELGSRFAREGIPLAAILMLGANPGQIGVLAALTTAPSVLVGVLAGDAVDRSRPRQLMIAADIFRALVLASVPLAALFKLLTLSQLFVVASLVGSASVLFDVANRAYLPMLTETDQLVEANTKLSVTASAANLAGPAISGLFIQWLTAPIAVGVTSISYALSAACLWRIRRPDACPPSQDSDRDLRRRLLAGFTLLKAKSPMMAVLRMEASASFFVAMFAALYPFVALKDLHLSPAMFGVTFGIGGAGAIAGAALHPWLAKSLGLGRSAVLAALFASLITFAIPFTHTGPLAATAILAGAQFLGDAGTTVSSITINSLRQRLFQPTQLGRVSAVFLVADGAAAMMGALASGWLGSWLGAHTGLVIACTGLTLSILWGLFSALRTMTTFPTLEPSDARAAANPAD